MLENVSSLAFLLLTIPSMKSTGLFSRLNLALMASGCLTLICASDLSSTTLCHGTSACTKSARKRSRSFWMIDVRKDSITARISGSSDAARAGEKGVASANAISANERIVIALLLRLHAEVGAGHVFGHPRVAVFGRDRFGEHAFGSGAIALQHVVRADFGEALRVARVGGEEAVE